MWWLFLVVFLLPPIGYGWGYRGWGPPYPSYLQRRRAEQAGRSTGSPSSFNHYSWSWGGDLVWVGFMIALFWAMSVVWWR
jgi:hypothetical protein